MASSQLSTTEMCERNYMRKLQLLLIFTLIVPFYSPVYAFEYDSANEPVYKLDEVDSYPKIKKAAPPRWPKKLRIYEGRVKLRFVLTKGGKFRDIEITQSIPNGVFDQYALEALQKYRIKPAIKDGKTVGCFLNLPIEFELRDTVTTFDAYKDIEKGSLYINKGEYDKAIEAFNEALSIDNRYSSAYSGRGFDYAKKAGKCDAEAATEVKN